MVGDRRPPLSRIDLSAQMASYEGVRLDECPDGVRAVAEGHVRQQAPAISFIVASWPTPRRR